MKCLDRGHNLGQYMTNKHNVLHKTWADRSGVYIDTLYLKRKKVTKTEEN
jgi:hypothetical protein